MKINNIIILICSFFAFSGTYFAVLTKFHIYIGVSRMDGFIEQLYVIPLYLLVISILALKGKIVSLKSWYLPATIYGLFLSFIAYCAAERFLEGYGGETSIGLGGIYLFSSYLIATIVTFIDFDKWRSNADKTQG